jgi:hypothetical protein
MSYRNVRTAFLGVLLLAVVACAATTTREYTGPTLPNDQIALIESGPYTHIERVDGQGIPTLRIGVLPGEHSVELRPAEQEQPYREYLFYSWVTGSVRFRVEAGHRYLVYVDFVPASGPADEQKGSGYTWIGYVLDKSTGRKVANTGRLPLGVEPRLVPGGTILPMDTMRRR